MLSYHAIFFCLVILGDKYIGDWSKGEMHGQGVNSQADGSIVEGSTAEENCRILEKT